MKKSQAFTLPEALISMVAFSIASLALFQLMIFGMRTFQRSDGRSATRRELLKASQRLVRELAPCPTRGMALLYLSGPATSADLAISFASPRQNDGSVSLDPITQLPVYSAHILYYRNSITDELRRYSQPTAETNPLPQLGPEIRLAVQAGRGQLQLKDCVAFELLNGMDGVPDSEIRSPLIFCLKGRSRPGQLLELRFLAYAN